MTSILLVEDNEMNRDMLSRRLTRRGYRVQIAVDGMDALAQIDTEIPDLILMDMSLPLMTGWEATERIKSSPHTSVIPLIALTAHATPGDRQKAMELGCDDFDVKPVDFERLLEKIERLVPRSEDSR